jgi:uncharacterized protein involved in type VI secretion and phage assembly
MDYHELANTVRSIAQGILSGFAKPRTAEVTSYNPDTHSVKVTVEGVGDSDFKETGWIPLNAVGVGKNFGVASAPNIGDMVEVSFSRFSIAAPKIVGRFFSNVNVPPSIPAGETWVVHKSGSLLKFHNDGTVEIKAASTITYTATQHHFVGPVQMDNTVLVKQTITGQGGMAVSGDNGSGNTSTITGNLNTTGQITNNGHRIDSSHQHVNSGGSGLGGVPQ